MIWTSLHPRSVDLLGFIPEFLHESDPRPAREQFNNAYAHGGGWHPFDGFTFNPDNMSITYPGDPEIPPVAYVDLREERVIVYPHAWVAILQTDGSVEIARMD